MAALFSIDWFPLWLSLRVAALATLFVLSLGTLIAYLFSHKNFRGKDLLDSLITLPLVLPPTVLGYYLLVLVGRASPLGRITFLMGSLALCQSPATADSPDISAPSASASTGGPSTLMSRFP